MSDTTADEFRRICERAREHREEFWAEVAAALTWVKPWDKVLDDTRPPFYRWFAGGMLNTCYNAVDRHVDSGRADRSEEHTSELQSRLHLVCRLLLEKKKSQC